MNLSVSIPLVAVIFLLSACANTPYFGPDEAFKEDKAIIFLKQRHQSDKWTFFGTKSRDLAFGGLWKKMEGGAGDKKFQFWAFRDPRYAGGSSIRSYQIEPGTYFLSYIEVPVAETFSFTAISPVEMVDPVNGIPLYLSFEVKAGEVVYLGSARADIVQSTNDKQIIRVTLDDEYEEAKSLVTKYYPNLTGLLKKKLATVGVSKDLPGTVVDKF